jgi:hypothetical protein
LVNQFCLRHLFLSDFILVSLFCLRHLFLSDSFWYINSAIGTYSFQSVLFLVSLFCLWQLPFSFRSFILSSLARLFLPWAVNSRFAKWVSDIASLDCSAQSLPYPRPQRRSQLFADICRTRLNTQIVTILHRVEVNILLHILSKLACITGLTRIDLC